MATSTVTSEHRPKLKLALCLDTRLLRALGELHLREEGREHELAQLFNVTPMVSYPALQVSLYFLPNPPSQVS